MKEQLTINFEEEVWLPVVGYEEYYEVSNLGRVRSKRRKKILTVVKFRYSRVTFSVGKKEYKPNIHRLVAKAFLSNPNNHPIINHIDSNTHNNNVNNLEWCDHKHNTHHGINAGRITFAQLTPFKKGNISHTAKMVVNLQSGVFYENIKMAALHEGVPYKKLVIWLKKESINRTFLRYA